MDAFDLTAMAIASEGRASTLIFSLVSVLIKSTTAKNVLSLISLMMIRLTVAPKFSANFISKSCVIGRGGLKS